MSIQSTAYITREEAIDRIKEIAMWFLVKNYREVEINSFDPDVNMLKFVDNWIPIDVFSVDNWTNKMLEDYMDSPFFRYSMFDNYLIEDEV